MKKLTQRPLVAALAAVALAAIAGTAAAGPVYHLTDLGPGTAYGRSPVPSDVVGENDPGHGQPVRWHDGVQRVLPAIGSAGMGMAWDVNASGQVAGLVWDPRGHAARWNVDDTLTELVTGHEDTSTDVMAFRINTAGTVLVQWQNPAAYRTGYLTVAMDGTVTDFPLLRGGSTSTATALNDAGDVVGYADTKDHLGDHCVMLHGGVLKDLGLGPAGNGCQAYGVNAMGEIVGRFMNQSYQDRAFSWRHGTFRLLGTLGGRSSIARDVNASGQVIGSSTRAGERRHEHPFLWSDGVMYDLESLLDASGAGWHLQSVGRIGDDGAIVGTAWNDVDGRYWPHAVVLSPATR
jgi:probable HAF family extracellular repeat protein